jgi:hypothetical protein
MPGIKQKANIKAEPLAIATAELTQAGWQNLNIAADRAIDAAQLQAREANLLNLHTAQFTKAWEIIRDSKMQRISIAPTIHPEHIPAKEAPETRQLVSEGWRSDIVAFDIYLGELVGKARVPDEASLQKRVTIVPGDEQLNSQVVPVTDGAGGYVDLSPDEDTVQFQVNNALKGQHVKWEFELAQSVTMSSNGVVRLIPQSVRNANAKPFLTTLFMDSTSDVEFKAGDLVKLEGTIGDASLNKGLAGLTAPTGAIAVYHLDSVKHPVFGLGLTNVKISGPTRKTTARLKPAPEVTAFAKDLLRACLLYDEKILSKLYASEVQLLPGNRLFYFGLEVPGKMTEFGVAVHRDEMLVALKQQADRDPMPFLVVGSVVNSFRIEQLDVPVGEYATEPNQPGESLFQKLHFKIEKNDVLLKLSLPGAFRFLQLRKTNEQWVVIAEY